jgi:hypothetical protein
MKKQLVASLFLICLPLLIASCVSTILQEKAPTFSKDVSFTEPDKNIFIKINRTVYPAWKNKITGNVISIVSDCKESSSAILTNLHLLITDSIENSKLTKQQQITFKKKPAVFYVTEGLLEGESIEVHSLSLKRKNCSYLSSLSGKPDSIASDQKAFDDFNESLVFE